MVYPERLETLLPHGPDFARDHVANVLAAGTGVGQGESHRNRRSLISRALVRNERVNVDRVEFRDAVHPKCISPAILIT